MSMSIIGVMRQATMIAANVSSSSTISAPALDSAHSSTMYSMPESRPPEWLSMPVSSRFRMVFIEKSYSFAQVMAWTMPPNRTGSRPMHAPRRRTGPFGRRNSSALSANSANGRSRPPRPMKPPMKRCSQRSSAPSIGSSARRVRTPNPAQIAPHAARLSPALSCTSGAGSAFFRVRGALVSDFGFVVFLAAKI